MLGGIFALRRAALVPRIPIVVPVRTVFHEVAQHRSVHPSHRHVVRGVFDSCTLSLSLFPLARVL